MKFELDVPQVLSILDPVGDIDGSQVLYQTSKGEISLPRHVAKKLDALKLSPGEEISVCRYQRDGAAEWVVCPTPRSEKARAAAEAPELERQLAESLTMAKSGVREFRATGTDGPPAKLAPKLATKATPGGPSGRIGYREALKQITGAVTGTLRDTGEQWSDQAKQDAVSTLFIAAARAGMIVWDFEQGAA